MTCNEVREFVDLDAAEMTPSMEQHFAECESCRAYRDLVAKADLLIGRVVAVPGVIPGTEPETIERIVKRAQGYVDDSMKVVSLHPSGWMLHWKLAVAAAVLIACGFGVLCVQQANQAHRDNALTAEHLRTIVDLLALNNDKQELFASTTADQRDRGWRMVSAALRVADTKLSPARVRAQWLLAAATGLAVPPPGEEANPRRALMYFEEAVRIVEPGYEEWTTAQFGIGFAAKNLERHNRSANAYREVIRVLTQPGRQQTDRTNAWLAMAYHYLGWAWYEQALASHPVDVAKLQASVGNYEAALRLVPYPKIYYNLALAYRAMGKADEAKDAMRTARSTCDARLQENPKDFSAFWQRAFVNLEEGRNEDAMSDLKHAVEGAPAMAALLDKESEPGNAFSSL